MLQAQSKAKSCHRVEYVLGEIERAQDTAADVAFYFSHALHSLQQHATSEGAAISIEQAELIVRAIDEAMPRVLDLFRLEADRAIAAQSIAKAKMLAWHWANNAPPYGGHDGGMIRTAVRYVLWLRNSCHNFALRDEIEEFHMRRAREARGARSAEGLFR